MKLSIVVVSHNACNLLRIGLNAAIRAAQGISHEVFVVDNASEDGSIAMLNNEFPGISIIANDKNEGIAKAYNQALRQVQGEYVLLVNADTITGKKTVEKALEFMDHHTDAGGLGVRMITPEGSFLKESKRGFNRPWEAFFRLTGLARSFSKSRLNNAPSKDWVDEFQTSETDVINGAFMLLRRSAVNSTGLMDEHFHTYGYDIDYSYRIKLAGFRNYYFGKTYIINFDIQNKVKFSWKHVKEYYGAMIIFATKYLFKVPEIKVEGIPQLIPPSYEVK
jgi:GT2 family glycosyltransferase